MLSIPKKKNKLTFSPKKEDETDVSAFECPEKYPNFFQLTFYLNTKHLIFKN